MSGLAEAPWKAVAPDVAAELFAGLRRPWWISGGWAIDLFLGRTTRRHADLDVEFFARDQLAVQRHLDGWELWEAGGGRLTPWSPGAPLRPDAHQVWCRPEQGSPWVVELQFTPGDAGEWIFRRDTGIRRPVADALRQTPGGLGFIAPEIQLLYKAKEGRARDEADFRSALPALDGPAREWLAAALERVHPGHRWLPDLRG